MAPDGQFAGRDEVVLVALRSFIDQQDLKAGRVIQ
jgi:hypothetical protein